MSNFKKVISITVLIVIIVYLFSLNKTQDTSNDVLISDTSNDDLIISAQTEVSVIQIDKIKLNKGGFVVINEVINGRPGQILQVSTYLLSGINQDIKIPLDESRQSRQINISGSFPVTSELVAVVYIDDGDKRFNPSDDLMLQDNGKVLAKYIESGLDTPSSVIIPGVQDQDKDVSVKVIYSDIGFSPNVVEVQRGDVVQFINQSKYPMWVASNEHPAHDILPTFDQFTTSEFGESWQYVFDQPGEWVYHDHVNASMEGKIIVK